MIWAGAVYVGVAILYALVLMATKPHRFAVMFVFMSLWWPIVLPLHLVGRIDELLVED